MSLIADTLQCLDDRKRMVISVLFSYMLERDTTVAKMRRST